MHGNLARNRFTEVEYLELEERSQERHEFVNGEVLAMAGASLAHCRLVLNLTLALGTRLRRGPCVPLGESMRVHIPSTALYAYPDLSVVCGKPEFVPTRPESLLNPSVIVEVLSPSTSDYDLGAKAAHYRRIGSVTTLLFVDSVRRMVQLQVRQPDGSWSLTEQEDGVVRLLGLEIPLDEIYEDVVLDSEATNPNTA